MKSVQLNKLIKKEQRSYLVAATCSAGAALMIFYKLLLNELYLKILDYPWMGIVLFFLIVGNLIHGFFAFKSFQAISEQCSLSEIIKTKITFYKSLIVNFLLPYLFLIVLFIFIKEFALAIMALSLFMLMIFVCYVFDLRPILSLKEKFKN